MRGEEVEKEDTEEVKEIRRREGDFRAEEVFKPFLSTLGSSVFPEDPPLSCRSTPPPPSLTGGRQCLTNQRRLSVSPKLYDISSTRLPYSLSPGSVELRGEDGILWTSLIETKKYGERFSTVLKLQ